MVALKKLTEEEAALVAILMDETGIDLFEFAGVDETKPDRCARLRPYQWKWYSSLYPNSVCASARDVGKSLVITWRAAAHVHSGPGTDMFITAPGADHLRPLATKMEEIFTSIRLLSCMLKASHGKTGISKIPSFEAVFKNGAKVVTRLPKQDGVGVKGMHAKVVVVEECFPAGTLVITKRGFVPIEGVQVGDVVWTHRRRWRRVEATMSRQRATVNVKGKGHYGLVASEGHPFFAAADIDVLDKDGNPIKAISRPGWIPARELAGKYWVACTGVGGKKSLSFEGKYLGAGRKKGRLSGFKARSSEAAWVLGHWVAEGSCGASGTSNNGQRDRVYFSIANHELEEVELRHKLAGLTPSTCGVVGNSTNVTYTGGDYVPLASFLEAEFGAGAKNKRIPLWVVDEKREFRESFLEGLLYGDGHHVPDMAGQEARRLTTASRELAITAGVLGRSLGYQISMHAGDHSGYDKEIRGRKLNSGTYYTVQFTRAGRDINFDGFQLSRVRSADPTGRVETLYDLTVEEDHSFTADGFYVHNSQDFPELAWDQLYPTLRTDIPGARMELFGVTVGSNSTFDKHASDPESVFKLIRKIAPERPSWGPEERKAAIKKYGNENSIRYAQNILGISKGTYSDLFVTARLMSCVRIQESAWAKTYNDEVYRHIEIEDDRLHGTDKKPTDLLLLPDSHREKQYSSYWAGWDIGLTNDPSEFFVFGSFQKPNHTELSYRLLTRVSMRGISAPDQVEVAKWLIDFYGPRFTRLGLDGTGLGLPISQTLDSMPAYRDKVRGYGFSEKLLAGWEDRQLKPGEKLKDIEKRAKTPEYGLSQMRELVDSGRIELPMDTDLLSSLQGTFDDHCLHGCYMFGVALGQYSLEKMAAAMTHRDPVRVRFGWQ